MFLSEVQGHTPSHTPKFARSEPGRPAIGYDLWSPSYKVLSARECPATQQGESHDGACQ